MAIDVNRQLSVVKTMRTSELHQEYAKLHGERSRSGNRDYLIRRIIWRWQAIDEGDLTERAQRIQRRAAELARDADLRLLKPAVAGSGMETNRPRTRVSPNGLEREGGRGGGGARDRRLPMAGTVLSRRYQGRTIQVRVLEKGFEHEGKTYRSLSARAHAVTGSHWNGWLFFGLTQPSRKEATQ